MNTSAQKLSLRGSLAGDIAKHLHSYKSEADLLSILDGIFRANPADIICISEGGMLLVGKKSDRGKYSPDW